MSIIEKAMRKLNGGRAQPRPLATTAAPKVVEHPASQKISQQTDSSTEDHPPPPIAQQPAPGERPARARRIARLRVADVVVNTELTAQIAEEFRRIKRPLLANAYGKGAMQVDRGNLIMVTSSVPGEGKSRTSLNVAHSIALEPDHTVLLIDADVAKAQISRMYGLDKERGLTNLLTEGLHPEELIWQTESARVNVLPVGGRHSQSTELLNSAKMEQCVDWLVKQDPNRLIIFDAPPVLATNEPQVLVRLVGQIVLVVEAGRTPQHVVKEAVAALDPAKAIGLVLNKSQYSVGGDYYGHYYGGYYGYDRGPSNQGSGKGARK
jgi:protein-tyrosine kinase